MSDLKRRLGKLEDAGGDDDRPVIVVNWDTPEESEARRDDPNVIVVTWADDPPAGA